MKWGTVFTGVSHVRRFVSASPGYTVEFRRRPLSGICNVHDGNPDIVKQCLAEAMWNIYINSHHLTGMASCHAHAIPTHWLPQISRFRIRPNPTIM